MNLPKEILIHEIIGNHLTRKDIESLCAVSTQMNKICQEDEFWHTLLKQQYDYEFWLPLIVNIPQNTGSYRHLYYFFDRRRKVFQSKELKKYVKEWIDKGGNVGIVTSGYFSIWNNRKIVKHLEKMSITRNMFFGFSGRGDENEKIMRTKINELDLPIRIRIFRGRN